jgi:hypothetical protein
LQYKNLEREKEVRRAVWLWSLSLLYFEILSFMKSLVSFLLLTVGFLMPDSTALYKVSEEEKFNMRAKREKKCQVILVKYEKEM